MDFDFHVLIHFQTVGNVGQMHNFSNIYSIWKAFSCYGLNFFPVMNVFFTSISYKMCKSHFATFLALQFSLVELGPQGELRPHVCFRDQGFRLRRINPVSTSLKRN